jgi:hypothetical protein
MIRTLISKSTCSGTTGITLTTTQILNGVLKLTVNIYAKKVHLLLINTLNANAIKFSVLNAAITRSMTQLVAKL